MFHQNVVDWGIVEQLSDENGAMETMETVTDVLKSHTVPQ